MGYRSEVCLAIDKHVEIPDNILDTLEVNFSNAGETDKARYWYSSSIKWYTNIGAEEYKDIDELEEYLNSLNDSIGFLRIGEDADDVQEIGVPWDFEIYLNRDITYPTQ